MDVINYVHYEHANFESQISCSLGSAKKRQIWHILDKLKIAPYNFVIFADDRVYCISAWKFTQE
jgi:hypothetical protein